MEFLGRTAQLNSSIQIFFHYVVNLEFKSGVTKTSQTNLKFDDDTREMRLSFLGAFVSYHPTRILVQHKAS